MTTTKKPTKRENFNALLTIPQVASDPVLVEFVNHELDLLDKKNASSQSAERKPTKAMLENDGIRNAIIEWMRTDANRVYSITELIKDCPACKDMNSQRISGLFRKLYDKDFPDNPSCMLIRTEDKRKTYFQINPAYQG